MDDTEDDAKYGPDPYDVSHHQGYGYFEMDDTENDAKYCGYHWVVIIYKWLLCLHYGVIIYYYWSCYSFNIGLLFLSAAVVIFAVIACRCSCRVIVSELMKQRFLDPPITRRLPGRPKRKKIESQFQNMKTYHLEYAMMLDTQ